MSTTILWLLLVGGQPVAQVAHPRRLKSYASSEA
jgi:hypothetical protein